MENKPESKKDLEKQVIGKQRYFEKRLYTIVSGGLIAISVFILQTLVSANKLDIPETKSVICLAIGIPMLAGCIIYYSWLKVDYHLDGYKTINFLFYGGGAAATLGISFMIEHVSELAAWLFMFSLLITTFSLAIMMMGVQKLFRMIIRMPFLLFSSNYRKRFRRGEIL